MGVFIVTKSGQDPSNFVRPIEVLPEEENVKL